MTFHLWRPLLGLALAGELAASIRLPSAMARVPGGAPNAPPKTQTESVWTVGSPGQSCAAACAAYPGVESASCSEERTKFLDTEAEMLAVALDGNVPCDPSQGFGYSEYPFINTFNNECSFRRPWTYPASCHVETVPPSHRFCSCSGTWYRAALGASCDATCAANGGGVCEELPLEECITPECVIALGQLTGFPCSSATIYAKEFPSQLANLQCAYTYGYEDRCEETVAANVQRFCPCEVVPTTTITTTTATTTTGTTTTPGQDGVGEGDPHMTNIYGENFDINFVGVHSMIRIPGYGPRAGETFELSARVADFSHLKPIAHCNPYFFDKFDVRGAMLGAAVHHMEVLRDGAAGVSFSSVMAEGNQSLLGQNLTLRATLQDGAVFGSVTVLHKTRQHRDLLVLGIRTDPPVEVTVSWWNSKPGQPGLNLRVHGLRTGLGTVGGLLGRDPHGNVSSDPAIKGCPPRARADSRPRIGNATRHSSGVNLGSAEDEPLPDVVIN